MNSTDHVFSTILENKAKILLWRWCVFFPYVKKKNETFQRKNRKVIPSKYYEGPHTWIQHRTYRRPCLFLVCLHSLAYAGGLSTLDPGSVTQISKTLTVAAHASNCATHCPRMMLSLLSSHLLWDNSEIRQAKADMWNLCHLLNHSITVNQAALAALALRKKNKTVRPWLAYACGVVSLSPTRQDDKAAGGSAVISSCQIRIFSSWSLKGDAPTQRSRQEPLGTMVPKLLWHQLVWFWGCQNDDQDGKLAGQGLARK